MNSIVRNRVVVALAAAAALAGCQSVPYTGRRHLMLVSESEEKQMGEDAYKKALKDGKVSHDQDKVAMVRRVGKRIARAADRPDYQWEFNVIDDEKQVNAWCLPGGKVAFYSGIFPVAEDENGIAVVMGHEVSHALARHGSERMSQGLIAQGVGQAAGVFLAQKPAATQNVFNQVYGLGANLGILAYSRAQESEADHIGLILMATGGYDPSAAVSFWGRMQKASGQKGDPGLAKYLSTHPPDQQRQNQIKEWLPEATQYYKPAPAEGP